MAINQFQTNLVRSIRWHRREIGILSGGLCFFLCLHLLTPASAQTTAVLVANDDLAAGVAVAAEDVKVQNIPTEMIPDQALVQAEQAVGKIVTAGITRGSILTEPALLADQVSSADGDILVPFRVPDEQLVALLRVGNHISVVASNMDGETVELAHDVRVVALPKTESSALETNNGAVVVVAADRATAAKLSNASTHMRLAIMLV